MAELNARIIAKASGTAGEAPQAADLAVAEIAVNTADGKFFTKHTDGTIKEISGSGGGDGAVDSVNGQTGVVSLGIQDMDDFELNENLATENFIRLSGNQIQEPAIWSGQLGWVDGDFYIGPGNAQNEPAIGWNVNDSMNATLQTLQVGDTVDFDFDTSQTYTVTEVGGAYEEERWFRFNATVPYQYGNPAQDQAGSLSNIRIDSPRFPAMVLGDMPLAEGDILQWDDTDQKFKPAQLPSSGGGAVDSVNGQTGVVSLGIQDMDDYEAKTYLTWTTYDSGTIDADEYGGSSGTYLKFSTLVDGQDVRSLLLASGAKHLQYGDKVVGPFFGQMLNVSGQSALYLNENSVITAEIRTEVQSHGLAGGSINLYASNFPKQDPDDGDILQWSDADQKFKPAQLPEGGGAVDSVNGETGDVSLGIQEMDDFALNQTSPPSVSALLRTNTGTDSSGNNGELFPFSTDVYVSLRLADGTDQSATLPAVGSGAGTIEIIIDGTTYAAAYTDVAAWTNGADADWIRLLGARTGDLQTALDASANSTVEVVPIGFVQEDIPLAEGDILQWDDTDQKFKPVQLPSGGGAVDSVNGETGVVSLGIQDMDDFTTETTITVESVLAGSGYNDAENFRANTAQWFISGSNSDGNPIPGFPRVGTSGTFRWTLDGTEYTVNYTDVATGAPNNWFIFSVADTEPGMDQLVSGNHGKTITFEFDSATNPLQDGTLVQWDARNQTFKPGQPALEDLSNVAKSVVYRFVGGEYSNPVRSAYAGQWGGNYNSSNLSTYLSYVDADNRDLSAVFRGLPTTGQVQVWYSTDGTTFQSSSFSSFAPQPTGYQSGYGLFRGTVLPGSEGDDLFICFSDPSLLEPADGDVLVWVDANNQWEPAALPSGGGAVDSVNGETGVVSLGIQDMDDFELNELSNPAVGGEWIQYDSNIISGGRWGWVTNSGKEYLLLGENDSDGDYFKPEFDASGGNVWIQFTGTNGTEDLPVVSGTFMISGGVNTYWSLANTDNTDISTTLGYDGDTTRTVKVWFSDPGLTKEPLAEGDILQWVEADQKFKPVQLPAGGSGAVDSVNGQTGDVSLALEDLDNVETVVVALEYDTRSSSAGTITSGKFLTGTSPYNIWLAPVASNMDATSILSSVEVGDTMWWRYPSQTSDWTSAEVSVITDLGNAYKFTVGTPAPSWPGNRTDPLEVTFVDPSLGKIRNYEDGDVLKWSAARNQWESATPASGGGGGGGVDSVNGETGDVSLGIQDMDDFELYNQEGDVVATWSGTWMIHTLSNNQCSEAGEIGPGTDNGPSANICITDGDGIDRSAEIEALANGSLWFRVNGGLWTEAATGTTAEACTPVNKLLVCSALHDAINAGQIGDTIDIADGFPVDQVSLIPLAEGDLLQWSDADQKFKPAQAKQRVQDMDDFELNEGSPWPYDFVWNTKTTPGPTAAGEWGTNLIFWSPTDAEGRNYSATGIMQFWLSSDNATWIELNANVIYFAADDYYYIDGSTLQSTQIDNEGWTTLYLSFTDPTGHNSDYTSLAEGDILQWNNVDQKFKPAQAKQRVQDMDDFAYNLSAPTPIYVFTPAGWNVDANTTPGQYTASNTTTIYFKFPDQNGTDGTSEFSNHDYTQDIYVSVNNTDWTAISGATKDYENGQTFGIRADNWGPLASQLTAESLTTNLYISLTSPQEALSLPLVDGDLLQWVDADQKFKPAQPSIASLGDWDQTGIQFGQAATWDGTKWVAGYPLLSAGSLAGGGTQDSTARVPADMIGPASNYANQTEMENDGWTIEGAVGDDTTSSITVPQELRGTTFFGVDLNVNQVFNGTNGNICWDNTNNTGVSQGRGGNFVAESEGRDFYMAHFSQDAFVRQIGHKWDGTYWTIRADYRIPYNEANSLGCPVETTFGTDGSIKVVFGTNSSSTGITGTGGIATSGAAAVSGWGSAFDAIGDFTWVSIPGLAEGRRLSDLLDVSLAVPSVGEVPMMQSTGEYVPTPITVTGAQDYTDYLAGGFVTFTEQSATPDQDGLYNIIDNGDGTGSLIFKTASVQGNELIRIDEDEEFEIAFDNFEIGFYKRTTLVDNPDLTGTKILSFSPAPSAAKLAAQVGATELYVLSTSFTSAESNAFKYDRGPLIWSEDQDAWTPGEPCISVRKLQSILEDCDDFATFKARILDY